LGTLIPDKGETGQGSPLASPIPPGTLSFRRQHDRQQQNSFEQKNRRRAGIAMCSTSSSRLPSAHGASIAKAPLRPSASQELDIRRC
jgi:hypothetical protein